MSWWELIPTLLWTAALTLLPGYLVARCWGLAGVAAAGAAAPVSIGLIATAAVVAPWLKLSWHALVVAVPAVVLALAGLLLRTAAPGVLAVPSRRGGPHRRWYRGGPHRRWYRGGPRRQWYRGGPHRRWHAVAYLAALLIPATLLTGGLTSMVLAPGNISQTYDNIFHLNAVRYILDTGSASSLTLGGMYSDGANPSLYPGAWHALVSLVVSSAGVSIPVAVNAVTLVVGAVVWPLSIMLLTSRVTGTHPVPMLFAGAFSAAFGAYPYLMVDFGVLYPYFLALALLPAALALVVTAVGVARPDGTPRRPAAVVLLAALGGLGLAHPSTVLALAALAVPVLVVAVARRRPRRGAGRAAATRFVVPLAGLVAYLACLVALWTVLRPSASASGWAPVQTIPQALGQVLAGGVGRQGPSWVVLACTLVAIGLLAHGRFTGWVLGAYLVAAGLFVVVSAVPDGDLRDFLTGVWYNDTRRLAGQLPALTAVVCAATATWVFHRLAHRAATRFSTVRARLRASFAGSSTSPASVTFTAFLVVALCAAVGLGSLGQYGSVNYAVWKGRAQYETTTAPVLSTAERALLERLPETVPPDATILGNPWTGTALAYALGERRTLTPHVGGSPPPKAEFLMNNLHRIEEDPRVCAAVRELHSYYVLAFAGPQVHGRAISYDGLKVSAVNPGLTRVDAEGPAAVLYRVTGC